MQEASRTGRCGSTNVNCPDVLVFAVSMLVFAVDCRTRTASRLAYLKRDPAAAYAGTQSCEWPGQVVFNQSNRPVLIDRRQERRSGIVSRGEAATTRDRAEM